MFHDLALGSLGPPAHPASPEAALLLPLCSGLSHCLFIWNPLLNPLLPVPQHRRSFQSQSLGVSGQQGDGLHLLLSPSSRQQARPLEHRTHKRAPELSCSQPGWVSAGAGTGVAAWSSSLRVRLYSSKGHPQASPKAPGVFSRLLWGYFSTLSATNRGFLVIPRAGWAAYFPWIGEPVLGHPTPWATV